MVQAEARLTAMQVLSKPFAARVFVFCLQSTLAWSRTEAHRDFCSAGLNHISALCRRTSASSVAHAGRQSL